MRIEAFGALVVVVWLSAVLYVAASNQTLNLTSRYKSREHHHQQRSLEEQFSHWTMQGEESTGKPHRYYRVIQELIRQEAGPEGLVPVECCPSIVEMIEPQGGRNRNDMFVELYRDGDNTQRFFEYSCRPDVLDKPCRWVDKKLQAQSRCVQKFSYTYAIVQNPASKVQQQQQQQQQQEGEQQQQQHRRHQHHKQQEQQHQFPAFPGSGASSSSSWTLDYIKVRSGCGCEFTPKARNKKASSSRTVAAHSVPLSNLMQQQQQQHGSEQQSSQQDSSSSGEV